MSDEEAQRRIQALERKVALLERIFLDMKNDQNKNEQKNRQLTGVS
jgi:hypothetical protein